MAITKPDSPKFQESKIVAALRCAWAEQTGSSSRTGDPFAIEGRGTVMDLQPAMDSLRAVETLLEIEKFVPFELPDDIVMKGGYFTEDQFLDHLVGQVKDLWNKHLGILDVKSKEKEEING